MRSLRSAQVLAWLEVKKSHELSQAQSVKLWLAHDAMARGVDLMVSAKAQRANDAVLNIPPPSPPEFQPGPSKKKYPSDHRKNTLYLDDETVAELRREANRQMRGLSWLIQTAWTLARERIRSLPTPR